MVVTKVLVVADRGEEGTGWAAIDDFEFLYDVFEVRILYISSSGCQINFMHFKRKYDIAHSEVCLSSVSLSLKMPHRGLHHLCVMVRHFFLLHFLLF